MHFVVNHQKESFYQIVLSLLLNEKGNGMNLTKENVPWITIYLGLLYTWHEK